ncbi:hypothetical protein [Moraxella porci]|uniref:hypothetical protein n=1 Tax=Moraxella porci TaxID=1288392 RepID=UPI00244763F6|nr:hypothetical protein [Moraxella porci]MDH2272862.1 hypothetical protein [Moraxella porci]
MQPDLVSVAVYQNDLKTTLALILCVYCNAKLGKYHQVRPAKMKKSLFFLWNKGKSQNFLRYCCCFARLACIALGLRQTAWQYASAKYIPTGNMVLPAAFTFYYTTQM